jgi:hypothetical protein
LPGFVTSYSKVASNEDKAEIFGVLMTDPGFLGRRVAKDSVIANKARLICERVEKLAPGTLTMAQLDAAGMLPPNPRRN